MEKIREMTQEEIQTYNLATSNFYLNLKTRLHDTISSSSEKLLEIIKEIHEDGYVESTTDWKRTEDQKKVAHHNATRREAETTLEYIESVYEQSVITNKKR